VLTLIYEGDDVVIIDVRSATEVGRIAGAGSLVCQEVLYDVSIVSFTSLYSLLTLSALP
jgi:hypothetical protein